MNKKNYIESTIAMDFGSFDHCAHVIHTISKF